jgi:hypothetical protein
MRSTSPPLGVTGSGITALDAVLEAERDVSVRLAAADIAVGEIEEATAAMVARIEREAAAALAARLEELANEVHRNTVADAERRARAATYRAAAFDALDVAGIREIAATMVAEFVEPLRRGGSTGTMSPPGPDT